MCRLALCASVLLAACGGSPSMPPPVETGPCHADADYVAPTCEAPATQLGTLELGSDFFEDAYARVGLEGHLGRRVTFGDVDGDRYPDFISIETGVGPNLQHLFLNQPSPSGSGRVFVEATEASGIRANHATGRRDAGGQKITTQSQTAVMVAFGDVDHDGDLDLFSGSYSQAPTGAKFVADSNQLYLNDGHGHFTLKTRSGVDKPWPLTTSAAVFLDYDLDGQLDLFVGNFMIAYPVLDSYNDDLYRGGGDGTFALVNDQAGITATGSPGDETGNYTKPTYGVTSCDWNDDGWPDILTSTYALGWNDLWKNNGDGTLTNVGVETKFYMDDQPNPSEEEFRWGGNTFAAACADYDNDGDLDVMTAETTHGDLPRALADRSRILVNTGAAGSYVFDRPDLAVTGIDRDINMRSDPGEGGDEGDHGVAWLDLDNDGLLDLVIEQSAYLNSHAWLFHQRPDHSFEDVTFTSGVRKAMSNSNGLTVDDYDRDGDLDILMGSVAANGVLPPTGVEQLHLYENKIGSRNNSIYITLHGVTANAQGIGARILVTAGCLTQTREIIGGKGTFGAGDPAYAHFGLGQATRIDQIEIRWPTNPRKVQVLTNVAVNQFLEVTEDSAALVCQPRG